MLCALSLHFITTIVLGHGMMTSPRARNYDTSSIDYIYELEKGYGTKYNTKETYSGADMRCHGQTNIVSPRSRKTLIAGQQLTITMSFRKEHPGDCYLYLSTPGQDRRDPKYWYKIAAFPGCSETGDDVGKNNTSGDRKIKFTVPEGVQDCNDCVLRWEWVALHLPGKSQISVNCADVNVRNSDKTIKPTIEIWVSP
eukprot:Pgem_evm1s12259